MIKILSAVPLEASLIASFSQAGLSTEIVMELSNLTPLKHRPEVFITDTEITSVEQVAELRKNIAYTVIVVLSSAQDLDLKIEYLNVGADAYFERPISPPVLLAHLLSLLRRKNLITTDFPRQPAVVAEQPTQTFWQKVRQRFKRSISSNES